MVSGLAFFTLACHATISASYNGVGTHAHRLNEYYDRQGRKWFMFFQIFYVASTVPIKSAICIALLRITQDPKYRYPLTGIIALATVAAITTIVTVLAQCQPVAATWDKREGTCADPKFITNVSYFISVTSIVTDWTCAILPVFILWNVKLRFRIKASVAAILALEKQTIHWDLAADRQTFSRSNSASSATIIRLRYLLNYNNPNDYLYGLANIALWSIIESGTGIIAGSLPTLRPLLRYIPFMASSASADPSASYGDRHSTTLIAQHYLRHYSSSGYRLESRPASMVEGAGESSGGAGPEIGSHAACEAGKHRWEELSDAENQKFILMESHVSVTNEPMDPGYRLGLDRARS
ncbi:hypothetical protein MPH_09148 [Macrophomina phaseolina MS6]|uniref:Rhodopsin domain-containing protein n=1 Tax=Macrophomina phaseolina (strain MS6) TaxID=1126212 RepID=K2RLI7_MACPH|nr:hypothetical protein MPH_09148 [Macrophomina phaseolina MS6]